MLKLVLVVALIALAACHHDHDHDHDHHDRRAHFKIRDMNVLTRNKTGGVPFGIGTRHPDKDLVWFKKMRHGEATKLTDKEMKGINIYMKVDDCSDHDHDDHHHDDDHHHHDDDHHHHDDDHHHHRCRPHIAGFVKVDSPCCGLQGRYLIGYGKDMHRFRVRVKGCRREF